MNSEGYRLDLNEMNEEHIVEISCSNDLLFELNHTNPNSKKYQVLLNELLDGNIGENSNITPPIYGVAFDHMKIGNNVYINSNCLAMARGGITIENDVMLAANVQLLSNNHDLYNRNVLLCKPILIKRGAWIGAGATILPGVTVGKYAVVGAAAVVTKDIPDYGVVVGNPAKVIKILDRTKFND